MAQPMTDELDESTPSSYTTESVAPVANGGSSIVAPGQALGRRKEAVARVRIVPGTGTWTINGRSLESYFPNKLHQQLVNSPFTLLELEGIGNQFATGFRLRRPVHSSVCFSLLGRLNLF